MAKVVGFEMNSQEPEKAFNFYENVFGWEVLDPVYDYWEVETVVGPELMEVLPEALQTFLMEPAFKSKSILLMT